MSKRFLVGRTVMVRQGIVIKADSESKALELARKSKFKDWSDGERGERKDYTIVEMTNE